MSEIIYDGQAADVQIGQIRLNSKDGAIQLYKDEEAMEDFDEMITFESPTVVFDFIDALEGAMSDAGYRRAAD